MRVEPEVSPRISPNAAATTSDTTPSLSTPSGSTDVPDSVSSSREKSSSMQQISGFKRPLSHTNSFGVDTSIPKYGIETKFEEQLAEVVYRNLNFPAKIFFRKIKKN